MGALVVGVVIAVLVAVVVYVASGGHVLFLPLVLLLPLGLLLGGRSRRRWR
jgi:hypothetical protein